MKTKFLPRVLTLALIVGLTGCAAIPKKNPPMPTKHDVLGEIKKAQADWAAPAIVEEGQVGITLMEPLKPPRALLRRAVDVDFGHATTLSDVAYMLSKVNVAATTTGKGTEKIVTNVGHYKGTLGGLFNLLSHSTNTFFTWQDGMVIISQQQQVAITVPQDEDFLKKVAAEVKALGAEASTAEAAGMLMVTVKPDQLAIIKQYLPRIARNAAVISLQVGVINVSLNRDRNTGVDWSKLQAVVGGNAGATLGSLTQGNGTTSTATPVITPTPTTSGTTPVAPVTSTAASSLASQLVFGGGALSGQLVSHSFAMAAALNFLDSYGTAKTMQNVVLKTIAGNTVKLDSTTKIPYVSGVGVGTVGTSGSTTSIGTASTQTADAGISVKLTPSYDADAKLVTVKLDLKVDSIIGSQTTLSAGQLGSFSGQPTTDEQSFNNVVRLRPGQTVVVGGVRYESLTDNRAGLTFLNDAKVGSKHTNVTRNEMFVIIRPTVTVYGRPDGKPQRVTTLNADDATPDENVYAPDSTLNAPAPAAEAPVSHHAARHPYGHHRARHHKKGHHA